jgi:aspartate aminotransferase
VPDVARPASRVAAIAAALRPVRSYLDMRDELRREPGVSDFVLGDPQEMPLPGFVDAIRRHAEPQDKDWFAYKRSVPEARCVVAKALREWRGLPFEPEDIALTPGAFGALEVAFRAFLDPGDEVVFSLPPWFLYEPMLLAVDAVPVKVRVRAEDNNLDIAAIGSVIGPRTRAVIVNTSRRRAARRNPTGRIYPPDTLAALSEMLTVASDRWGRTIWLISDEPYARLVFSDSEFHSPSEFYPHALISYSYGKVPLTPGERIGWLALSPSIPNRQPLCVHSPDPDDVAFCQRLADQKVLVLPGTICEAPGHFRISLTASNDMIDRAIPAFRAAGVESVRG